MTNSKMKEPKYFHLPAFATFKAPHNMLVTVKSHQGFLVVPDHTILPFPVTNSYCLPIGQKSKYRACKTQMFCRLKLWRISSPTLRWSRLSGHETLGWGSAARDFCLRDRFRPLRPEHHYKHINVATRPFYDIYNFIT